MQQFQVPQFIDVEDKIFGPLTIKQFIYILGGTGTVVMLYLLQLPLILFFILACLSASFFGALAFMKINGQPFVVVLNNALNHITRPRLFIWKREQKRVVQKQPIIEGQQPHTPRLTESKLKDLSWSLDINSRFKR
jgi:hypothetical protein